MDAHVMVNVHDDSGYSPSEVDFGTLSQPNVRYRNLKAIMNRLSALSSHLSDASVISSPLASRSPYFWRLSSVEIQVIGQSVRSFQREPRCISSHDTLGNSCQYWESRSMQSIQRPFP